MATPKTPQQRIRNQRRYKEWAARQLRLLGDRCHICGHPGATELDHIISAADRPDLMMNPANVRPAHGTSGCPVCPRKRNGARRCCNQERQTGRSKPTAKVAAPKVATNPRGCPRCHGAKCNNGVPNAQGMAKWCW